VQAPAQSSPLLYDGRIYFTAGQTTVAIDAKTCKELWRYEWQLKGKMLSPVNRGLGMKDGRLMRGTSDGFLIALSMADGKLLWERQITSFEESHYLSMPAMIVDDIVVYGTAGADWGGQGWIGGFSLRTVRNYGVMPRCRRRTHPELRPGERRKPSRTVEAVSGLRSRWTAQRTSCSYRLATLRRTSTARCGPVRTWAPTLLSRWI